MQHEGRMIRAIRQRRKSELRDARLPMLPSQILHAVTHLVTIGDSVKQLKELDQHTSSVFLFSRGINDGQFASAHRAHASSLRKSFSMSSRLSK
jgi:hypothetical protein